MVDKDRPMRWGRNVIAHPASEGAEFARHIEGALLRDALWKKDRKLGSAKKRAATIAETKMQIAFLHDIFGNPFLPKPPATEAEARRKRWLRFLKNNPGVLALARTIYDQHDFSQMPALADALENAGWQETDIASHCRTDTVHIRGCRALEQILRPDQV